MNLVLRGKRKFIVALLLGALAFVGYMFTPRTIEFYGALLGFFGVITALYNDANVKENGHGS